MCNHGFGIVIPKEMYGKYSIFVGPGHFAKVRKDHNRVSLNTAPRCAVGACIFELYYSGWGSGWDWGLRTIRIFSRSRWLNKKSGVSNCSTRVQPLTRLIPPYLPLPY